MQINIDNMTQAQIEELFSREKLNEHLAMELEPLINQLPDEYFVQLDNILGYESTEFVHDFVGMLGNPKVGIPDSRNLGCRLLTPKQLFTSLMRKMNNDIHKVKAVMELTDGILYDVKKRNVQDEYSQWFTITYIEIDFPVSEDALELIEYKMFRLPMVECPDNWTENNRGGYFEHKRSITTNRGSDKQPQQVCDVLNMLQKQAWKMSDNTSIQEEEEYLRSKFKANGDTNSMIELKTQNALLTAQSTYDAMHDKEFYFEWRYDFRGRMYSTGYNLNIQSDKYKKACLIPIYKGQ